MRFWRKKKPQPPPVKEEQNHGLPLMAGFRRTGNPLIDAQALTFQRTAPVGEDSSNSLNLVRPYSFDQGIPDQQLMFFSTQGFIGFQSMAMISQNWLVNKSCLMPAQDAARKGWELALDSGDELSESALKRIEKCDKRYGIHDHIVQYLQFMRIFGIRLVLFVVDSDDHDFYEKPFNIDGVKPKSFKGLAQIDPYWVVPELTSLNVSHPEAQNFYEPTYWTIAGKRYHRSHFGIVRGPEVPDVLKPTYFYAGMSVPQMIYERVYAAERTANEAPALAMSKRSTIMYTDLSKFLANQADAENALQNWAYYRDNYGVKMADRESDNIVQFDTGLADFDAVVMTQYQLVASIAGCPSTKLLGTQPKGFNATGEYEESSYHETLESLQRKATPFLERYYQLLAKSEFGESLSITVRWNELDAMTEKERAEVNKIKTERDNMAAQIGAIDGADVRRRMIKDENSDYAEIEEAEPWPDEDLS